MVRTQGETLRLYFAKFDYNGDPHTMTDLRSMQVNIQVHCGLFRYLPDGEVKPELAESWKFSDDRLELLIKLKAMTFSDGTQITAEHVAYSFARLFLTESSMAADLNSIAGSSELKDISYFSSFGVQAVNPTEVLFKFGKPNALALPHLAAADCAILPLKLDDLRINPTVGTKRNFIGAGAYRISHQSSSEIILEKWRQSTCDSSNPPEAISIQTTDERDIDKIVDLTKTDSLDQLVIPVLMSEQLKLEGWHKSVTDMTREIFLIINPNRVSDGVRRRLASRINSAEIAQAMGQGFSEACGFIPSVLVGALTDRVSISNAPMELTGPIQLEVVVPEHWDRKDVIIESLKKAWTGVDLIFKLVTAEEWSYRRTNKDYQIMFNARGIDYPDPISILNYFRSGVQGNYYFIDDREVDDLLTKATSEFDLQERAHLYRKIQMIVLQKAIVVPLFFGSRSSGLWSARVSRVPDHPLGYHLLPLEMIEMKARN